MSTEETTLFDFVVKKCSKCGELKERSEFHRERRSADGLQTFCRECKRVRDAARMQRNREANAGREIFDGTDKTCPCCKLSLPKSKQHWSPAPSKKDGLQSYCVACSSGKSGDLLDRIDHLWQKERNTKRTKDRVEWIDHGKGEWMCLVVKQKCRCALTGVMLTKDNVSIDHVVPVGKGGTHEIENLRLVTREVNEALSDRTDEEFIEMCRAAINAQMNLLCYGTKENPGAS